MQNDNDQRTSHVGYYLIGKGISANKKNGEDCGCPVIQKIQATISKDMHFKVYLSSYFFNNICQLVQVF